MQLLFTFAGDGWWPRISPDGNRVIFGGGGAPGVDPMLRVWTRARNVTSPPVPGRAGRFLSDGTATFVRYLDNERAVRLTLDTNGGNFAMAIPTNDDPNLVGGNDFVAGDGWASARVSDMRLAVNNRVVPGVRARQVRTNGSHILVTEGDNEVFSIRSFANPTVPLWVGAVPPTAHVASLGARNIISYGYESPFGLLNSNIADTTSLPWRRENNAVVVEALDQTVWAWSSGQRLDTGDGLVIGRPVGSTQVVEVPFDGSGGIDVRAVPEGFLVAGASAIGVLQVWLVPYNTQRGAIRVERQAEPEGTPFTGYVGYWYDTGKYGDFTPASNSVVVARGLFENGDRELPPDMVPRIDAAVARTGIAFLGATDIDLGAKFWPQVHAVFTHEPSTPDDARAEAAAAVAVMNRLKLPRRPVMTVLTTTSSLNPDFAQVSDWIGVEIYHDKPASTWNEQVAATEALIEAIMTKGAGSGGRPVMAIPQAYDRNGSPAWINSSLLIEAIQYACQQQAARFKGLLWFSYARPGGVIDYPTLLDWHAAQVRVTTAPAGPVPPTKPPPTPKPPTPKPPTPKPPTTPGDDMTWSDLGTEIRKIPRDQMVRAAEQIDEYITLNPRLGMDGLIPDSVTRDTPVNVVLDRSIAYLVNQWLGFLIADGSIDGMNAEQWTARREAALAKTFRVIEQEHGGSPQ